MFNSTHALQHLFGFKDLFINTDEEFCHITHHLIKDTGCVLNYTGNVLSLNKNNDTLPTMNNKEKKAVTFCIDVRTKDQKLTMDNIKYT